MSDNFSLESYEPDYDSVEEFLEDSNTPHDYKMSAATGAIRYRQENKGDKSSSMGTRHSSHDAPSEQAHMSKIDGSRQSVTDRVIEDRHGKAETPTGEELQQDPNDPAHW